MHWSESIARKIIERNPSKAEYVCATGISPSGSIHIGNFRDIATSWFVVLALRSLGKKARLLHSWDNFDRLRKIPANVTTLDDSYIGFPLSGVPNPFPESGHTTYAEHFEAEFTAALTDFGIEPDFRNQTALYRAGAYREEILLALRERGRIFDILDSFRTQAAQAGERESYYPAAIYCPECKRDTTRITAYCDDSAVARYECRCGHSADFDFNTDTDCKLAWKVDWAMRWRYEGIDFEPGGQDHASPTGSYQTSKQISEQIFGFAPPIFQGYGFIGLKGAAGKMSGSTGLNLTPATLLKIYEPEVILWLYHKTDPMRTFDFCFDDGILRQYFEYDKQKGSDSPPMTWLVQFGSVVNFNPRVLETVFTKIGTPFKEAEFAARLKLAQNWLEMCSPDSVNRIFTQRCWKCYEALSESERAEIAALHSNLAANDYTLDELNTMLYAVPAQAHGAEISDMKQKKALQTAFFKNVYSLIIGKEKGPRLYLFLHALEKEQYLHLLDFSHPKTAAESEAETAVVAAEPEQQSCGFGEMTVQELKPEIEFEAFKAADIRVCEIIKAQEIRKSNNCLKLTVHDGHGERVIVAGISRDYSPAELVGRKVIAVMNLAPVKITGVESHGMVLAAANDNGSSRVIFVDGELPNGAALV
jgi:lysyl-tRNA synthetase class 1